MISPAEMPQRRTPKTDDVVKIPATRGTQYIIGRSRGGLIRLSRHVGAVEHYVLMAPADAYRLADALVDAAERAQTDTGMGERPSGINHTR